ncbi:MAG: ketosteroid isomerase-like protein [Tardiphaga sp.]|jgi:ketosteroid isomerase-like protein|nr:ketosteroid isomerase-like protein [Tardiphaga sp.]
MMTAAELVQAQLRCMTSDPVALRALFAENAVWELLYGASAGVASPLSGIDHIVSAVRDFTSRVEGLRFGDPTIYRVEGDDAVFAEFYADATVIATGRSYHQDYVFYLRARGGKIVLIKEYFDAVRLVAAFGETSDSTPER